MASLPNRLPGLNFDLGEAADMLQIAHASAAVFFLDRDPEHAEIAELAPQVGRECIVLVDRGGTRRDLIGGESLDRGTQHVGGFAEVEVEAGQAVCQ